MNHGLSSTSQGDWEVIDILEHPLISEIKRMHRIYTKIYPVKGPGFYAEADWHRISYALERFALEGDCNSVLDVGVGCGQFINAIAESGWYEQVAGLDLKAHSKFVRKSNNFEMHYASVADMPFSDGQFDIISCMEVLEHLETDLFHEGLRELRRVCGRTLFMTVPFDEPEPLPSFHKQRFTAEDIARYWPKAECKLLKKRRFTWAFLTERK